MWISTTIFQYSLATKKMASNESNIRMSTRELAGGSFPALNVIPGMTPVYILMEVVYERGEKPMKLDLEFFRTSSDGVEKPIPSYVRVLNVHENADSEAGNSSASEGDQAANN